ncbi:MAG: UDP-N-acetylglucosamine 1-carboxyvinyltransferase, partial [Clostridia bacterium]
MIDSFKITGGKKLYGSIDIESAKNAVLPLVAGALLTQETIVINNIPDISDVYKMFEIIRLMGGSVEICEGSAIISATLNKTEIPKGLASEIRSSIFMLGSLLATYKIAKVAYPGGCDIGSRPIDLHLMGLRCLGAKIIERHGYIYCNGENMKSGIVHLDFPSVGATENIMMASVMLEGDTFIYNPAKEPEIEDLQNFINAMGGIVSGAGTSVIKITGVKKLHGVSYTPIPDRIVAGTYLIAGAMAGGKIELKNVIPEHIYSLITKLTQSGCVISAKGGNIYLESNSRPISCPSIATQPYPGFPTDLQAQILALQSISNGISIVTENLFETRFKHVAELIKMGAKITVKDRSAIVHGVSVLYGAEVEGHDLRGTASLVLAGLCAEGVTTVHG